MFSYPKWRKKAVCATHRNADDFISESKILMDRAKKICYGQCPVRTQCLDFALENEGSSPASQRGAVYGGLGPQERYRLRNRINDELEKEA